MKNTVIVFGSISMVCTLVFFGPGIYKHFGTRYQDADRKIFEQNKSFIHGTIQHVGRLKLEYESEESEIVKKALRSAILAEANTFDLDKLPINLQNFILKLRSN